MQSCFLLLFSSAQRELLTSFGIEDLALCSFTPSKRNLKGCSKKDDDSNNDYVIVLKIILNLNKEQSIYHNTNNCTEEWYHLNHFQNYFFQLMNDKNIGGTTETLLSVTFENAIFELICYVQTVVHTFPDICFQLMPFLKLMMIHWATSSQARFFLTCPTKTDSFQFQWLLALREGQLPTFKTQVQQI